MFSVGETRVRLAVGSGVTTGGGRHGAAGTTHYTAQLHHTSSNTARQILRASLKHQSRGTKGADSNVARL